MNSTRTIRLRSGQAVGHQEPCFIVAEIGNNHQGELAIARDMVRAAVEAGAQAVKFQKRDMESMFTRAGMDAPYTGPNSFGPTYGEHRLALELSIEDMIELKELTESLGAVFFASAWDRVSLFQMQDLGVELIKICSADLVNVPMLRQAGAMQVPVILSTGMSSLADIDLAVRELSAYHDDLVVLHCNSSYPCPEEQIGLPVMARLRERYGLPVGYSGHERGIGPSVAAAALGACVIERHFTLDKGWRGTDHQVSLDPSELARMVRMVREVEAAMRVGEKCVFSGEAGAASKLRKSIVFSRDLPAGHVLGPADLAVKCPGTGVSPLHWDDVLGKRLSRGVRHEEMLAFEMLAPDEAPACRTAIS